MNRYIPIFVPFLAIALAACANNPVTGSTGPQASIDKLVNSDAQAALADAQAHNDTVAVTCYQKIVSITTPVPGTTTAPVGKPGVLFALQKARDLKTDLSSQNTRIAGLNVACAPLVFSDQATLLKLVAPVGIVALP